MSLRRDAPVAAPSDHAAFVSAFVERLRHRAALAAIVEAALAGALAILIVAAAWTLAIRTADPRGLWLAVAAAVVAGAGWMLYRRRAWSAANVAARAESHDERFRNALVTTLELEAYPGRASARIRGLVASHAATAAARVSPDSLWPARWSAAVGLAAFAIAATGIGWLLSGARPDFATGASGPGRQASSGALAINRVLLRIVPPAYTGRAPTDMTDVDRVEALAGSRITVRVLSSAPRVAIKGSKESTETESNGSRESRESQEETNEGNVFTATVDATATEILTVSALDASGRVHDRRAIVLAVREDAPPDVDLERPGTDLIAASAAERVAFAARATDDLGLAGLTLHYTRVTGSGEQFSFVEGRLPWTVAAPSTREWRAETSRVLAELGLAPGDLIVYYAKATDRRPGAPPSLSDSYVIEVGKPQQAISGGFAVPPEEDRQGISLSALIQKTERLDARRGAMPSADFADAARGLAIEQRMVRTEVLFLMGAHGHVEDEEEEAAHSNEIQEGRLENRGQAELRVATRLMTTAERHLTVADTRAALVDQRRALAALQRALSRQRYFLRTLPVRSRIDASRRLTGDLGDARSWTRATPAADTRLLEARRAVLSELSRAARTTAGAATDLASVASGLLALDPASAALQQAAAGLLEAASPRAAPSEERRKAIKAATQAVLAMSPRSPASAAANASPSRATTGGALVDALNAGERRP